MIEILETKQIALSDLTDNKGQIDGIPKNPRFIKDYRYEKLVKSIRDNPEFLGARELIVNEHNGKFVVLCGNMRYRAAKELGFEMIPCKVIPEHFTFEQRLAIIIKDNISFGDDDFDALANEWNTDNLADWGLELPIIYTSDIDLDSFFEEDNTDKKNKFKIVLEYTEEDYNNIIEAFKLHSGSKEQIVAKLLGL